MLHLGAQLSLDMSPCSFSASGQSSLAFLMGDFLESRQSYPEASLRNRPPTAGGWKSAEEQKTWCEMRGLESLSRKSKGPWGFALFLAFS